MTALSQQASNESPASAEARRYTGALVTVTTLFFMWGFLTALNDILVPHLKSIFDLNYAEVMLIQLALILPAICYLYILYYALRGSRPIAAARA